MFKRDFPRGEISRKIKRDSRDSNYWQKSGSTLIYLIFHVVLDWFQYFFYNHTWDEWHLYPNCYATWKNVVIHGNNDKNVLWLAWHENVTNMMSSFLVVLEKNGVVNWRSCIVKYNIHWSKIVFDFERDSLWECSKYYTN